MASLPIRSEFPPLAPADKPLLAVLRGERRDPPPMWLMRQAGRYLPEYRALRAVKGGFLDMAYDPEAAAEITLQPLQALPVRRRDPVFGYPHRPPRDRPGTELRRGRGTAACARRLSEASLDGLKPVLQRLEPIWATVARVKAALSPETTFLGFAGSPWTVATYMVAGQGSREQAEARSLAYLDPGKFAAIIARIEAITVDYLSGQVKAGVDAVQLFDSWSGSLAPAEFERWVIAPTARIVDAFRARHPDTPIIGFPKGAGGKLRAYAAETARRCDRARRDGRSGVGQPRIARQSAGAGQSRPARADRRRRDAGRCGAAHP